VALDERAASLSGRSQRDLCPGEVILGDAPIQKQYLSTFLHRETLTRELGFVPEVGLQAPVIHILDDMRVERPFGAVERRFVIRAIDDL
jgi:hypothetical protein